MEWGEAARDIAIGSNKVRVIWMETLLTFLEFSNFSCIISKVVQKEKTNKLHIQPLGNKHWHNHLFPIFPVHFALFMILVLVQMIHHPERHWKTLVQPLL